MKALSITLRQKQKRKSSEGVAEIEMVLLLPWLTYRGNLKLSVLTLIRDPLSEERPLEALEVKRLLKENLP